MSPAGKVGFPTPASACRHLELLPNGLNTLSPCTCSLEDGQSVDTVLPALV